MNGEVWSDRFFACQSALNIDALAGHYYSLIDSFAILER